MEQDKFFSPKTIIRIFAFLALINLLFLDAVILKGQKTEIIERNVSVPLVTNTCPVSCLSEISKATKGATLSVKPTSIPALPSQGGPTPTPTIEPVLIQTQTSFSVKEFFVPFGTGSNSSDDWQDLAGLKATIDPANYGSIKTVTFEASVRIPTGNEAAYVRLYNSTDKHPVWFSDVSLEEGTPQLLISKPITLDSGNKTYQIQMKTSLKYPAFLDQSRLHIITN
jgi:hypothetical protein